MIYIKLLLAFVLCFLQGCAPLLHAHTDGMNNSGVHFHVTTLSTSVFDSAIACRATPHESPAIGMSSSNKGADKPLALDQAYLVLVSQLEQCSALALRQSYLESTIKAPSSNLLRPPSHAPPPLAS